MDRSLNPLTGCRYLLRQIHPLHKADAMEKLEVTIWNADGEVVHHSVEDAGPGLTDEELRDAVSMIEHGTDARTAVMLAKQHQ